MSVNLPCATAQQYIDYVNSQAKSGGTGDDDDPGDPIVFGAGLDQGNLDNLLASIAYQYSIGGMDAVEALFSGSTWEKNISEDQWYNIVTPYLDKLRGGQQG